VEKEIFLQGNNDWIAKVDVISFEFHNKEVADNISKLLKSMNFEKSEIGEKKIFRNLNSN
jgi:hypothetical protein